MGLKRGSRRPPPRPKVEPLKTSFDEGVKVPIWTPTYVGEEDIWMQFLHDSKKAVGGRWQDVHEATDIRLRALRAMRDMIRQQNATSDLVVDRIMERCQPPGWTLQDMPWYTSHDLVLAGVWKGTWGPGIQRTPGRVYRHRRWYGYNRWVLGIEPPPITTWSLTPVFNVDRTS